MLNAVLFVESAIYAALLSSYVFCKASTWLYILAALPCKSATLAYAGSYVLLMAASKADLSETACVYISLALDPAAANSACC